MGGDQIGTDYKLRTCFVGDSGVGKTALFTMLTTREAPRRKTTPTLATNFSEITIPLSNGVSNNKYLVWDCPGHALTENRVLGCCVRMSVVFVCFDPQVRESWLHVPKWLQEVYDRSPDAVFAVVKVLRSERDPECDVVTDAEIEAFAKANFALAKEVDLTNIDDCLQKMSEVIHAQHAQKNVCPGTKVLWDQYLAHGSSVANDNPMQERERNKKHAPKAEKVASKGCCKRT